MGVANVQVEDASSSVNGDTTTLSGSATPGNTIVVSGWHSYPATPPSVTNSESSTVTLQISGTFTGLMFRVWTMVVGVGGTYSITFHMGAGVMRVAFVEEVVGAHATTPIETTEFDAYQDTDTTTGIDLGPKNVVNGAGMRALTYGSVFDYVPTSGWTDPLLEPANTYVYQGKQSTSTSSQGVNIGVTSGTSGTSIYAAFFSIIPAASGAVLAFANAVSQAITASLAVPKALAFASVGTEALAVALTVPKALTFANANSETQIAALSVPKAIAFTSVATESISAALSIPKALAFASTATEAIAAALSVPKALAFASTATETLSATFAPVGMAFASIASEVLTTALDVPKALSAALSSSNATTASLLVPKPLATALSAIATLVANLTAGAPAINGPIIFVKLLALAETATAIGASLYGFTTTVITPPNTSTIATDVDARSFTGL